MFSSHVRSCDRVGKPRVQNVSVIAANWQWRSPRGSCVPQCAVLSQLEIATGISQMEASSHLYSPGGFAKLSHPMKSPDSGRSLRLASLPLYGEGERVSAILGVSEGSRHGIQGCRVEKDLFFSGLRKVFLTITFLKVGGSFPSLKVY